VSPATDSTVGFVGLGAMGSELARALLEAGTQLVVFDTRREAVEALEAAGAAGSDSVADLAQRAGTVLVSLPTPDVVREVVRGEGGLLRNGTMATFVDLSTTGFGTARELAALLSERGVDYLDAPLSGGVAGARDRKLGVFAAGEETVLERCRPLLEPFAATIVRVGPEPGQGQLAKVLNNLLSASAMTITSEAMTFGVRAGLDPGALLEAFNAGSGRNTATTTKFPAQVLPRRFESGFRLELMLKDVRLALDEARAQGVAMPLGAAVEQLWMLAGEQAEESTDHTEIVRLFEGWAGVSVAARRESANADA
jgi:3-hydroxyisobutyrate dehydrogenase-like beta-hydroxyacid dehydrogenase